MCVSVLRVASGPRVKLASCKSALNPTVVYSTDRSKAVDPVLSLTLSCFVVYSTFFCFETYVPHSNPVIMVRIDRTQYRKKERKKNV